MDVFITIRKSKRERASGVTVRLSGVVPAMIAGGLAGAVPLFVFIALGWAEMPGWAAAIIPLAMALANGALAKAVGRSALAE